VNPSDLVTVLVCTKDRPGDVERAVRSLLATEGVTIELIVVDQSDGQETETMTRALSQGGRLRYVRSKTRGKGAAMNEGLMMGRSEFVVCTDDDCEAPPNWVAGMATVLEQHPEVGAVFSNVVAGPYDPSRGYVPTFERKSDRLFTSVLSTGGRLGLGAGMALRREAVLAVGGIDEALGPGARFPSGDDHDIELRLLMRGWAVFHTAQIATVHHGFRSFADGREHARRDWTAIGAYLGKLGRAGHPSALLLAIWVLGRFALLPPLNDVAHARPPQGLVRITSFFRGLVAGVSSPVDRRTMTCRRH
jgi:GT2 family glycosyltransferase